MRFSLALINLLAFSLQIFSQGPHFIYLPLVTTVSPPTALSASYRSGQTFVVWNERADLQGERYRIYRSTQPITASNLSQAALLATVGKNSARFYANRFNVRDSNRWAFRYVDRYVIDDGSPQIEAGKGLLVWTLRSQDFGGATSGVGYYAVTVTPAGGKETLEARDTIGPVVESVADPLPVEITSTPGVLSSTGEHIYIQYMDLSSWNPTFHAPSPSNRYYGFFPTDPGIADALQYAYDYTVYTPKASLCDGSLPSKLPVILHLHGYTDNTSPEGVRDYLDPQCAYGVYPEDVSDTWYFGFARHHDYRQPGEVTAGDEIVNYTEQRILRMLYDLMRDPPGPAVDSQRVYVDGQSMGASGVLALTQRYPNVFAAGYASQPITNYLTAGVTKEDWVADAAIKWGRPALNLPVSINAPHGWAVPIQKYNGTGVWDWQNYQDNASAAKLKSRLGDEMAPVGIIHGSIDPIVTWSTQGKPVSPAYNTGKRVFGSMVTEDEHQWMYYYGMPPTLGAQGLNMYTWKPFWKLEVVRNETLPALSNLSGNSLDVPGGYYNQTVMWSSSWNDWDGAPIDQTSQWRISLCAVKAGSDVCGTGVAQTVDVTPRRIQKFKVTAGAKYDWENRQVFDNTLIASGTVTADSYGLITVKGFEVSLLGNRLVLSPH